MLALPLRPGRRQGTFSLLSWFQRSRSQATPFDSGLLFVTSSHLVPFPRGASRTGREARCNSDGPWVLGAGLCPEVAVILGSGPSNVLRGEGDIVRCLVFLSSRGPPCTPCRLQVGVLQGLALSSEMGVDVTVSCELKPLRAGGIPLLSSAGSR